MPLFRRLLLSVAFLLFCQTSVSALEVPKQPEGYVSDYAHLLSDSARSRLEQSLKDFEEKTGNQVLVAVLPGLQGDSLESYSIRLAEAWKPGQKGKDNGVILLIFKEDRKVRIEVGYGLEGVLTDALCKLIIENEIAPRFRAGDYDGGIEQAVAAILSATRGEYHPLPHSKRKNGFPGQILVIGLFVAQFFPTGVLKFLFFTGILGVVAAAVTGKWVMAILGLYASVVSTLIFVMRIFSSKVNSSGLSGRGYYRGYGGGGFNGGGFGGGFGGGGGGFSGGGGGFGGGGASGSW